MAKGKFEPWLQADGIARITNWAAKGCTHEEIAHNMGIRRSTLNEWIARFPAISDAIKDGRAMSVVAVENVFFKRAVGGEVVTETIEEFRGEVVDGKPYNGTIVKRTVKKALPPDVTAMIFYLKNRAGYRSEPQQADEAGVKDAIRELARTIEDASGC